MKIQIIAVGAVKEKYLLPGIVDYAKRLKRFCDLIIVELSAQSDGIPESKALLLEAEAIRQKCLARSYKIALSPHGNMLSSEALAAKIPNWLELGQSQLTFIIGSSRGLDSSIIAECQQTWSFGPITLTHGLARLIAVEQIYRAFKINAHEAYHK